MEITSRDFYDEIEVLADSLFNDYEYGIIKDIEEKLKELEELKEKHAELLGTDEESEVNEELESLSEEIKEMIDNMQLSDSDFDYISDYVHEIADGHEWVIYYNKAWTIARLMSSDDSTCRLFDDLGCIQSGKSLDDIICQFAYCAIEASLNDELENALERKKEELLKKIKN